LRHLPHSAPRVVIVGLIVAVAFASWGGTADAHATVVSSYPAQDAHLGNAPASVSVVFDQPVKPESGGLVVLDSSGAPVSTGSGHPAPDTLDARLPATLGAGPYVANYTVTSVDGHVVSGGLVFLVGNAKPGQIGQLARHTSALSGAVDKVGQFLIYVGVLASAGLAFFLAFILGEGPERSRLRRWCVIAAAVGVIGMFLTTASQTALTGGSWGALGHFAVVRQAVDGKFGAQSIVQLVALAVCVWSARRAPGLAAQLAAFYGLLVAAGAFVLFGHASVSSERWLSTPADVAHAVVASLWFGGLIGLICVLRVRTRSARLAGELTIGGHVVAPHTSGFAGADPRPVSAPGGTATALLERSAPPRVDGEQCDGANGPPDESPGGSHAVQAMSGTSPGPPGGHLVASVLSSTADVVGRFSTMAGISISVLLVAGVLLSIAEVGSVWNLFNTSYGQILLVKIALVGVVAFVACYNRFLLLPFLLCATADNGSGGLGAAWRRLLATVRLEAIGVVAILAVTAILANSAPSNTTAAVSRPVPFDQTQPFEGGHITLRITPNQALVNNVAVQFTSASGAPVDKAESVSAYLILPSQNVGPIITDLQKVGIGRFVLNNTPDPPIVGSWDITLQIQVDAFDEPDASFVDQVR
jgi:putative copper export protein/methionine-rich copper-binding protein CopC